ncbi:DoxX family protein [Streptomyces sp. NBC_00873]|uniref:DoxX family protein n=1 Tax=unclassified Streptomyces TaxID=2593676 RepID=UPI00386E0E5A|nr:DoxX family protein [Streptomyces sp. NBC_00873]WTA48711.1 DoxX family protein [Streptomyces sp. NBC_00842]
MSRPAAAPEKALAAPARAYDIGLLVLRLALGLVMAAHGTQKLFGWFGGGGIDGTGQFFAATGYPSPSTFAVVAGLSETLGGLGLALGLLTPLAAAAVAGTLVNAISVKWGGGFFAPEGVEYEILIALTAVTLALTGPGRIAVDRLLPWLRSHRVAYGVAAIVLGAVVAGVTLLLRH